MVNRTCRDCGKRRWPAAWATSKAAGRNVDAEYQTGASTSLVVDPPNGAIPYQPWAREQKTENAARYIDPYTHCLPITAPRIMASPRTRQIAQYKDYLTIINESGGHPFRVVYLDGRPHLPADLKLWRGDSRGRWEGNVLVIETTNLNGLAWFGSGGDFFSDALKITERLTLVDADTIDYTATIDDPKVSTAPWTMAFALERNKEDGYEQMEEGCFESDRDTADLAAHRVSDVHRSQVPQVESRRVPISRATRLRVSAPVCWPSASCRRPVRRRVRRRVASLSACTRAVGRSQADRLGEGADDAT